MKRLEQRNRFADWLERPATIRRLWIFFLGMLALTLLAQWLIPVKGYFGWDGVFGFGALFGFLSCAAMIVVAKILGRFLKRHERYYQDKTLESQRDMGGDHD